MVQSISNMIPHNHYVTAQKCEAEQDSGWHSSLSIREISELLESQEPFTYIISPLAPDIYLLSFVRENDQGVIHMQFDKSRDGNWHYVNGQDNIMPTLKGIIRKMMHLADTMPDPIPFTR